MLTRIVDVVVGALAQAVPSQVVAAPSQFMNSAFGGRSGHGDEQFVYFELLFGGTGARPDRDGSEAMCSGLDVANIPVEVYEATSPMRVERFEVIPDAGGAGRFRGGCGVRKDVRVLADSIVLTNMGDRTKTPPVWAGGRTAGVDRAQRPGLGVGYQSAGVEGNLCRQSRRPRQLAPVRGRRLRRSARSATPNSSPPTCARGTSLPRPRVLTTASV